MSNLKIFSSALTLVAVPNGSIANNPSDLILLLVNDYVELQVSGLDSFLLKGPATPPSPSLPLPSACYGQSMPWLGFVMAVGLISILKCIIYYFVKVMFYHDEN